MKIKLYEIEIASRDENAELRPVESKAGEWIDQDDLGAYLIDAMVHAKEIDCSEVFEFAGKMLVELGYKKEQVLKWSWAIKRNRY